MKCATRMMRYLSYVALTESRVPDPPNSLKARPNSNSITVTWTPPRNQNIMVRGYTIGWGIGVPDVYTKVLDGKQRYYQIKDLRKCFVLTVMLMFLP